MLGYWIKKLIFWQKWDLLSLAGKINLTDEIDSEMPNKK